MICIVIYFIGCIVANWLILRIFKNYSLAHPEETCKDYQWGYAIIGILLSWFTVVILLLGQLSSFNQLEWEEETQEELNEYMAEPEKRTELSKVERIRLMHEKELKAAQQDAIKHKNEF